MRNWWLSASVIMSLVGATSVHAVLPRAATGERRPQPQSQRGGATRIAGTELGVLQLGPVGVHDRTASFVVRHEGGVDPQRVSAWIGGADEDELAGPAVEIALAHDATRTQLVTLDLPTLPPERLRLWLEVEQPWGLRGRGGFDVLS